MTRLLLLGVVVLGAAAGGWWLLTPTATPTAVEVVLPEPLPLPAEASAEAVHQFCGSCHAYPPPDTFARGHWREEIRRAYDFFHASPLQGEFPSLESVALYYEKRAPASLAPLTFTDPPTPLPLRWQPTGYHPDRSAPGGGPGVTNVTLGRLFDKEKRRLDIVVCDVRRGEVLALQPYTTPPAWHVLGRVAAPCHAEVVDLDGDGILDILVADLGSFAATDHRVGSVVWLRGTGAGKFTTIPLLQGVGRVADVQAADFRRVGKKDLVVAVFGWHTTGEVLYLENHTTDWARPKFVPRVLDARPGAVHVAVGDIDNDGKDDIVALLSQEHETIVAFVQEGPGRFRKETVYTAPHPAYGSSGLQLVDLNGDGKLDVLYTNGDTIDAPYVLKPYHGVQWLENQGKFPFRHQPLTAMYGAMRAVAADFRGTGRLDIVAVSSLLPEAYPQRAPLKLDAMVFLEQSAPGRFVRHSVEQVSCDHFTCAAGDLDGNGQVGLVTGNFCWSTAQRLEDAVVIWKPRASPPR